MRWFVRTRRPAGIAHIHHRSATTAPTTTAAPTTTVTTATLPPIPEVTVEIISDEEIVFDYGESPCGTVARPDLSARAFAINGTISLVLPTRSTTA